jgi:hypothetical protein
VRGSRETGFFLRDFVTVGKTGKNPVSEMVRGSRETGFF